MNSEADYRTRQRKKEEMPKNGMQRTEWGRGGRKGRLENGGRTRNKLF